MSQTKNRREFMKESAASAAAIGAGLSILQTGCATSGKHTASAEAPSVLPGGTKPSEVVNVGLIGCGGRGTNVLMDDFMRQPEIRVIALCDPDSKRLNDTAQKIEKKTGKRPATHQDYRELLENKDLHVAHVATPDHWHCLPVCHACEVGLDVYVEKPISHSIIEGRAMVNAARKYKRIVQVGTQQRSCKHFADAVGIVQSGALGPISLVRTWNYDYEMPNGLGMGESKIPDGVDYDWWLGPAPKREFNSNRFHYQWRYFYDYAGGMMCDWGVHLIDIVHWAMNSPFARTISATGAKIALPDNRDTPDTLEVSYKFDKTEYAPNGYVLTYSNSKAAARGSRGEHGYGIEFHGSNGSLFVDRGGWEIYPQEVGDKKNKKPLMEKKQADGDTPTAPHVRNFLDCIKSRKLPVSDIEIGYHSTVLCQLGNIACRTGETIHWDAKGEMAIDSRRANKLLGRKYRSPWNKEVRHLPLTWSQRRMLA